MAIKETRKNKEEEQSSLPYVINNFLLKHRRIILLVIAVVFAFLVAILTYVVVVEKKNTVAITKIEDIITSWDEARSDNNNASLASLTETEDNLLEQLETIIKANRRLSSGARANLVTAEIYQSRNDWKNAKQHYLACAKIKPEMYMAPLSYYNAAVCAEELGEADQAIALYAKAFEHDAFKMKSRALFNMGRIEDQRGNSDAAIDYYEKMAEQFPNDSWTLLAKSRIIALEVN